ncbi:Crp/Fnr family transcriptional regulator [Sphingosinicella sp. LY1275]|uniref:Crp/Fnr family transcriptional regulator n=1 Tax=Sphingosinicella sp. LY1275 TaxID=3095379 RepID=UPI002ADEF681|nr:Crp/Fnr family transcriptional regulator [Sphingosinicella sp. LY1275]MEA1013543.1 Crp/Fnr family transcriptional regulator [Sphingosinicella sp. LY1275]
MPHSDKSPLAPLLRKLELWAGFTPDDKEALLALPHTLKTIEPAGYIVRDGDVATHSCLLRTGFVYRHKIVAEGARQIVSIHMAGDMVDLQNSLLGVADHNVQALTRCEVAFIPREAVREIAFARPAIGMAMWHDTLVDGSIFREWIANVGRRNARTRMAHLLCEFSLRLEAAGLGTQNEWELPMTQEQLGDCTGLTPVHVNRTLKGLDRDGLITRSNRAVTVNDWQKLAQVGDFQSRYLHLASDKLEMLQ